MRDCKNCLLKTIVFVDQLFSCSQFTLTTERDEKSPLTDDQRSVLIFFLYLTTIIRKRYEVLPTFVAIIENPVNA